MLRKRWIALLLILLLLSGSLAGCGMVGMLERSVMGEFQDMKDNIHQELEDIWDSLVDEINEWSENAAEHAITEDVLLRGKRELGVDNYTGSYEAAYDWFSGEEYIFGGAAVLRRQKEALEATYSLTVESGSASLYWLHGGKESLIADMTEAGTYEFNLRIGENFIVLKGEHFTGRLSLKVQ